MAYALPTAWVVNCTACGCTVTCQAIDPQQEHTEPARVEAELRDWLGRESHMPKPAFVATGKADLSGPLKESILAAQKARKQKK